MIAVGAVNLPEHQGVDYEIWQTTTAPGSTRCKSFPALDPAKNRFLGDGARVGWLAVMRAGRSRDAPIAIPSPHARHRG